MKTKESQPIDTPEAVLAALLRAAEQARLIALQSNTKLVYWKNGKIVRVSPKKA